MKHKMMRCFSGIIILGIALQNAFSQEELVPQRTLTFEEAMLLSLENNFGIKEAESYSRMKESEMKATRGLYLPHISLSASYISLADDIHLDLNPVKNSITPLYSALGNYGNFSGVPNPDPNTNGMMPTLPDDISTKIVREKLMTGLEEIEASNWDQLIQKQNFGFVNASFNYPIYAGGKIRSANKAASIHYDEARNEQEIKVTEVITQLVERYFGLVLASEAVEVRREVLNSMSLHMEDAKRLKEEGVIANAEFLHAKVYFSEADRELKKSRHQLTIAQKGLNNTLSVTDSTRLLPISTLFYLDSIPPLSYFQQQAEMNSLFLQKVAYKKELVNTKHHLEKGSFLPSVALMGTYQLANKDLSPLIPNYMVGVGLKWNLFEGVARLNSLKASELQVEQVDYIYEKTSSDIKTVITRYYEEMKMHQEQMEDLKIAYQFANEYLTVREKAFLQGMATASEVSDAGLAMAKVKIEMLQTMYAFDLSLSQTLYYSGISRNFDQYRLMAKTPQSVFE